LATAVTLTATLAALIVAATITTATATIALITALSVSTSLAVIIAIVSTTTTPATAGSTIGCFVDPNGTAIEFNIVHRANRRVGIGLVGELYEAKATAPTSIAVFDHNRFLNLTELLKLSAKSGIISVPGKAANEKFCHFRMTCRRISKGRFLELGCRLVYEDLLVEG
jgi:hypothetical protein